MHSIVHGIVHMTIVQYIIHDIVYCLPFYAHHHMHMRHVFGPQARLQS